MEYNSIMPQAGGDSEGVESADYDHRPKHWMEEK